MTRIVHVTPQRIIRRRQLAAVLRHIDQLDARLTYVEKAVRRRRMLARGAEIAGQMFVHQT